MNRASTGILLEKAAFYGQKQNYTKAIRNCEKVVEFYPQDIAGRYRLGLIYEQAKIEYQEVLRISPNAREAKERLENLVGR